MYAWTFKTTAGWVAAAGSSAGLTDLVLPLESEEECNRCLFEFVAQNGCANRPPVPGGELFYLEEALDEYFAGRRKALDFPVDWSVFTPFQQKILRVVRQIPYGAVFSYGQVAALAGYHRAARAAGGALRANRVLLVIPCHRVVRGDGTPGGFGGRPWLKSRLLAIEGLKAGPDGRYPLELFFKTQELI